MTHEIINRGDSLKIDLMLLSIVVVFTILFSIVAVNGLVLSSFIVETLGVLSIGYHQGYERIVDFVDRMI